MFITTPGGFLDALGTLDLPPDRARAPRAILVVTPTGFRVNEAAASDNRYMVPGTPVDPARAHAQHQGVVALLNRLGVPVVSIPGREGLDDAIFPNNVYGTVAGRFILGAMRHPARQAEARREDVRALMTETFGYALTDLSEADHVCELTGPLAIDRARGIGFCGMTGRVDAAGAKAMHAAFDLRLTFQFDLVPEEYHTNLVLAVLAGQAAVLHAPSFADPGVPDAIARAFPERTLWLSDEEKAAFCGNTIAVTDRDVVFSETAWERLRAESREALEGWGFRLHAVPIDELEKGGGSLRCLLCELF